MKQIVKIGVVLTALISQAALVQCGGKSAELPKILHIPELQQIIAGYLNHWHCDVTLKDGLKSVLSVAFCPTGKKLATGLADGSFKIWAVARGLCLKTINAYKKGVTGIAYSPDGKQIVSGGGNGVIKLWNAETGVRELVCEGHTDAIHAVAYCKSGNYIASASQDKSMRLWDVVTGECIKRFLKHTDAVTALAFSPDRKYIASAAHDGTIRLWNLATYECIKIFSVPGRYASVAFSSDSQRIVAGFESLFMQWHVSYTSAQFNARKKDEEVKPVNFSFAKTVQIWDIETGTCVKTMPDAGCIVASAPKDDRIVAGLHDGTINMWNSKTGHCIQSLMGHREPIHALAFSPDGMSIASGSRDAKIKIWRNQATELAKMAQEITPLAEKVVGGLPSASAAILDYIASGDVLKPLEKRNYLIDALVYSPDGQFIILCLNDGSLELWHIVQEMGISSQVDAAGLPVAYSPSGNLIACITWHNSIVIAKSRTGSALQELDGHSRSVSALLFSPDCKYLVSRSVGHLVKFWDFLTGSCVKAVDIRVAK